MRTLTIFLLLAALLGAGCTTTPDLPDVPQSVRVVVEVPAKIPSWATDDLPLPKPADGTVAERITSEDARGDVIILANCHRRLLRRLSAGEDVDPSQCADGVRPW
jgi:hypothetical protein